MLRATAAVRLEMSARRVLEAAVALHAAIARHIGERMGYPV